MWLKYFKNNNKNKIKRKEKHAYTAEGDVPLPAWPAPPAGESQHPLVSPLPGPVPEENP